MSQKEQEFIKKIKEQLDMVSNTSSANSREQNTKVFELTDKEILETFGFYDDVND
jgi:hypothetical protein